MKKLFVLTTILTVSGVSAATLMYGLTLTSEQDNCYKEKSVNCPNINLPKNTTVVMEWKRDFQPDAPAGEAIPNVKPGVRDGWECRKEALSSCGVDVSKLQ